MAKRETATDDVPSEVLEFFFGGDATMTVEQLRERNTDFLSRCASGSLKEGESIRTGRWVQALSAAQQRALVDLILQYDDWSEKTDPRGTHGNGVVIFDGNYVMWAIREVDLTPPGALMARPPREVCLLIRHSSEI